MEGWLSGLRHSLGKRAGRKAPWVRIPLLPPFEKPRISVIICVKEKITQLHNEGKSYNEIRILTGASKGTISYHLNAGTKTKYLARQRRNRKQWITDLKIAHGGKCKICDYQKALGVLDFHHLDEGSKTTNVSDMLGRKGIAAMKAEADKCVLLCSNCHREVHLGITKL